MNFHYIKNITGAYLFYGMLSICHAMDCSSAISPQMSFGNYSPNVSGLYDAKTIITIACIPGGSRGIKTLTVSIVDAADNKNYRSMVNSKNEIIRFNLYSDPNFTQIIKKNSDLLKVTDFFNNRIEYEIKLYGKIEPLQNVGVGNYSLNIPISIEWLNGRH